MDFSVNFHSTHKEEAKEIRCPYNQLGQIYDFIQEHPDKKYCIETRDEQTDMNKLLEQLEYVKAYAADYTITCGQIAIMQPLIAAGHPAFLRYPVSDWETFDGLLHQKVSDIYIDGPLCFQTDLIKRGKGETKIRVSPTISPNSSLTVRSPQTFFIRPEDLVLYEDVIDIIDFKEPNTTKEDALFEVYNRGSFVFELNKLIPGLTPNVNNLFIKPEFGPARLNCGQHCKIPGRRCHLCETTFTFTNGIVQYVKQKELIEKTE